MCDKTFKMATKYLTLSIRVSVHEKEYFKKMKEDHGLSARKVLAYSGCPCSECRNKAIIMMDEKNKASFEIKRGLFSSKIKNAI